MSYGFVVKKTKQLKAAHIFSGINLINQKKKIKIHPSILKVPVILELTAELVNN